ncbi:hypothetical protein Tco_0817929 [Tanacetum coccineum]
MRFFSLMGNLFGCSASGERLVSTARDGDVQEAKASQKAAHLALKVLGLPNALDGSYVGSGKHFGYEVVMVVAEECREGSGVCWWRRVEKVVVGRRRYGGVMVVEEIEWKMKKRLNY